MFRPIFVAVFVLGAVASPVKEEGWHEEDEGKPATVPPKSIKPQSGSDNGVRPKKDETADDDDDFDLFGFDEEEEDEDEKAERKVAAYAAKKSKIWHEEDEGKPATVPPKSINPKSGGHNGDRPKKDETADDDDDDFDLFGFDEEEEDEDEKAERKVAAYAAKKSKIWHEKDEGKPATVPPKRIKPKSGTGIGGDPRKDETADDDDDDDFDLFGSDEEEEDEDEKAERKVAAYAAKKSKSWHEEDEGKPSMLWERGLIPEYEDDPDVYRDTAWLLDRIILDNAEIVNDPVPPVVIYRFGSGKKQECVDGKKSLPAQCQWTGWVILKKGGVPEEHKLTVAKKYCTQAGLTKPANKIIDC